MVWMAAGAAVGIASSIMGAKAAAKQADRRREIEMQGALMDYKATESSANIMKAVNREQSMNLMQEAIRAGAAQNRDVQEQVNRVTSTVMAQSEGLTSGNSRGRQMVDVMIKGNKALLESKSKTTSVINQITEKMDNTTNELNNKLLAAHQQMATILTTPSAIYQQNPMEVVQAGVQGAQMGASLGKSFSGFSSPKAPSTPNSWTTGTGGMKYDAETMSYFK